MDKNLTCTQMNNSWVLNTQPDSTKWCFLVFASVIVVATVSFNLAVIIRLQMTSRHKYFTKFFLSSLAVADIFVSVTIIPFTIVGLFYDNSRIFGDLTCEIANSCDVMFTTTSIFHLSTLAFERFVALRNPLSYNRICSQKMLIVLFIVCWVFPAALSFGLILPKLHMLGVEDTNECLKRQSKSCVFVTNIYYATLPGIISIFLPILLIMFFNVDVCIIVRRQKGLRNYMTCNSASNLNISRHMVSKETRIALTIGAMTAVFLLCWLPFFILNIVNAANPYQSLGIIFPVCIWLGYANSAANPIVFLISDICHKQSRRYQLKSSEEGKQPQKNLALRQTEILSREMILSL